MSLLSNVDYMGNALRISEAQLALTTSNLTNQDTPNYKAKGIDFQSELKKITGQTSHHIKKTNDKHMNAHGQKSGFDVQYVQSGVTRADGNTVDANLEKTKFVEQQVRYQATLELLTKSRSSVINTLKGK